MLVSLNSSGGIQHCYWDPRNLVSEILLEVLSKFGYAVKFAAKFYTLAFGSEII